MRRFTSPLLDIGLKVFGIKFETSSGNILPIRLGRKIRAIKQNEEIMDSAIPNVAHILLRYGVSMECYHEITKIIGGPKSYKVTILYKCIHIQECTYKVYKLLLQKQRSCNNFSIFPFSWLIWYASCRSL